MDKSLNRITDRIEQLKKVIHSCAGGQKKHIFYGEETFAMRNLYKLLPVRDGDYRVGDSKEITVLGSLEEILPCKNFAMLEEEKEPFVVFVLPEAEHGTAIAKLEKLGLVNGEDYFVIPRLLPAGKGGYM